MQNNEKLRDLLKREDIYIACIAEGTLEQDIINYLLDENCLIFERDVLIDEKVLRCRSADSFSKTYLNRTYCRPILILRILDSKNENFKLKKMYWPKILTEEKNPVILNAITHPEIEILIIHNENRYGDFERYRSRNKGPARNPSTFVKTEMKLPGCKDSGFCENYFTLEKLINSIREYNRKTQSNHFGLYDLLKDEFRK